MEKFYSHGKLLITSEYLILNDSSIVFDKTNFVCPLILSVKGTQPFLKQFSDSIKSRLN